MSRRVLAVDFGTSTSHFSLCPGDELLPSSLAFDPNALGMESALLWREGREPLVGRMALDTWGDGLEEERSAYRLQMHFKPDIATHEEAWEAGAAYLAGVRREAERMHLSFENVDTVLFGVPSQAGEDWKEALRLMAQRGGFGFVGLVDEPVGALLYHLSRKDLRPSESMEGTLVVDFGGGTCDFAWMERLDVRASWGEMLLGGRLFDDLFYQILCERNPSLEERLSAEGAEYYVHWYECRRMKESFSLAMSRNREELWSGRGGNYGTLRDLSWEEFCSRASSYVPSPSFEAHLSRVEERSWGGEPVDLLEWFRRSLCEGVEGQELPVSRLGRVILSGGSSLWPFVGEILMEELDIPREKILRSSRPGAVIAEGMSLLPALQKRYRTIRHNLEEDLPRFVEEDVRGCVEDVLARGVEAVSRRARQVLFDGALASEVDSFREKGGSLEELRKAMGARIAQEEPRLEALLEEEMTEILKVLPREIGLTVGAWFSRRGIRSLPLHLEERGAPESLNRGLRFDFAPEELYRDMMRFLETLVAGVTSMVGASLCGGGGVALLMAGPGGLVLGGVAGLLAYGALRKELYKVRLPALVTKRMISRKRMEKVLQRGGESCRAMVAEQFAIAWKAREPQLLREIRRLVAREMESLSALNAL